MPSKIRRVQTRRCASHNAFKPQEKVRRGGGLIEKCSATRKEKLSVHRVAKVVNKKWRQTLRKCEIVNNHGYWFVCKSNGVVTMWETMNDAIEHAKKGLELKDYNLT